MSNENQQLVDRLKYKAHIEFVKKCASSNDSEFIERMAEELQELLLEYGRAVRSATLSESALLSETSPSSSTHRENR